MGWITPRNLISYRDNQTHDPLGKILGEPMWLHQNEKVGIRLEKFDQS